MTVQEFITDTLMDLGVVSQGDSPSNDESNYAFRSLNQILSNLSLEGTFVYTHTVQSFALQVGTPSYTLGPGGSWATAARPVRVTGAMASSGAFQSGCEVLPMERFLASVANGQGVTAVLPSKLGVDAGAPTMNARVWPTPAAASTIEVAYWAPLTALASLASTLSFPVPGYEAYLRAELAMTLAAGFGRPLPQELPSNLARFRQRFLEANASIETAAAE